MEPVRTLEDHLALSVDAARRETADIAELVSAVGEDNDFFVQPPSEPEDDTSLVAGVDSNGAIDLGQVLSSVDEITVPDYLQDANVGNPGRRMMAVMLWKQLLAAHNLPSLNVFADWRACHWHAQMSEQDGRVQVRPNVFVPRAFKVYVRPLPRRMSKDGRSFKIVPAVEVVGTVAA